MNFDTHKIKHNTNPTSGIVLSEDSIITSPNTIIIDPATQFGSDLVAWFKSDSGITTVSGKVSSWQNSVAGACGNLVQTLALRRPLFIANDSTLKNMPAIEGDGVNTYLETQNSCSELATTDNCTVAFVCYGGSTNPEILFEQGTNYSLFEALACAINDVGVIPSYSTYLSSPFGWLGSNYDITTNQTKRIINRFYRGLSGAAEHDVIINGITQPKNVGAGTPGLTVGNFDSNPLYLMGRASAIFCYSGRISELVVIKRAITSLEAVQLNNYLSFRYG